jgi:hypothetical protein
LLAHDRADALDQRKRRKQVQFEALLYLLYRNHFDGSPLSDSGTVYEHVDSPVLRQCNLHDSVAVGRGRDVSGDTYGLTTASDDGRTHLLKLSGTTTN